MTKNKSNRQKAIEILDIIVEASGSEVNLQPASREEHLQSIRMAQAEVIRSKSELKTAKELLSEEIECLDEYEAYDVANKNMKTKKAELEAAKIESLEVENATVEVDDAIARVGTAEKILCRIC